MSALPPKAAYKLCIAESMRNAQNSLKAVEEFALKNIRLHYDDSFTTILSNLFNESNNVYNKTRDLLDIDLNFGAPKNFNNTHIEEYKITLSRYKFIISDNIKQIKNYILDTQEYIQEYLDNYDINDIDKIAENLSYFLSLMEDIKNTLNIEYDSRGCMAEISFDIEKDEEDDDCENDSARIIESEFDYDNENENIEVLKSYCKEVFTLNECFYKDYNLLIDKSFENGMADAIPIAIDDFSKIIKNVVIWIGLCKPDEADKYIKEISFDSFLIQLKIRKEYHLEEYMAGNRDTYLPISSLLKLWFIIKSTQYYYLHT